MKHNRTTIHKTLLYDILFYGIMIFYMIILFFLLFHKKSTGTFQSVNMIPFRTISSYLFSGDIINQSFAISNLLGNIVIFIPMGIYLPLLIKRKPLLIHTIIISCINICVEIFQYIFAVGASDIDDVILNTIGGFIGILLFRILHLTFKDKVKKVVTILAPIGGIIAFIILILINM